MIIACAAVAISGCTIGSEGSSGIGSSLGLSVNSPDEFLIIASKPLQIPTSFTLPRPTPGAPSRVELDPFSDAHIALFNRPEPLRLETASSGEAILLSGASATGDNSTIRQVLDEEGQVVGDRRYGLTTFFGAPIPIDPDDQPELLESREETERLRQQGFLTPTAPPIVEE